MATTLPHTFSLHAPSTPAHCRRFVWTGAYVSKYSVTEDDRLCRCGEAMHQHSLKARCGGEA